MSIYQERPSFTPGQDRQAAEYFLGEGCEAVPVFGDQVRMSVFGRHLGSSLVFVWVSGVPSP